MNRICFISLILIFIATACTKEKALNINFDESSDILNYGYEQLNGSHTEQWKIDRCTRDDANVIIISGQTEDPELTPDLEDELSLLKEDAFQIIKKQSKIYILGQSDRACLYGLLELNEQLESSGSLKGIKEKLINPTIGFRAIKFNLPWSPYRPGPATDIHMETCRDLKFWEAFLDMMVENRFNALSLWNKHPFPYMVRAENYPKASHLTSKELREWQTFWKALFKMAKSRGIETYIVNWNIVVSPAYAQAYRAKEYFDRSEQVKKYTKESVTQVINEYVDLTGIGVTLADWMGNWGDVKMTSLEREDWIEDTFVAGMKEANRKVKFIHRAVLAGDPQEMRQVIDNADLPDKTIVEIKFNWSHAHSSPNLSITHANDDGSVMQGFWEPKPENFFIAWMMRNEDFFVLRWGDPEFIRKHIAENNKDYVGGYFLGSEGYIPALDYTHREGAAKTWTYAFQKQWLYYKLWGRLLYNSDEPDQTFESEIGSRYEDVDNMKFLQVYTLASKVPQEIATFIKGTWDFTLYSEGFLAPWIVDYDDGHSPFISLAELMDHETLDSRYLSIKDYNFIRQSEELDIDGRLTPLQLADQIEMNCDKAIKLINDLNGQSTNPTFLDELADLETWCHLGFYFADKLRAGVHLAFYHDQLNDIDIVSAQEHLQKCVAHWKEIIRCTEDRYKPMPYVSMGHQDQKWPKFKSFHWKDFLVEVERDLESLN